MRLTSPSTDAGAPKRLILFLILLRKIMRMRKRMNRPLPLGLAHAIHAPTPTMN